MAPTADRRRDRGALAGVRVLLEAGSLLALGYWGYRTTGVVLAVGLPLAVAVVWALLGSPAAPYRLGRRGRLVLEVAVFGGASLALYDVGFALAGAGFALVAAADTALLHRAGPAAGG